MQKLAIVGGGITWRHAPFNDPEYDIWTTGSISKILPRVSEIFDIHPPETVQPIEVLKKHNCTVWVQRLIPELDKCKIFPIDNLITNYGKIFNCSMTMILAFAYERGYKHIELYGVDMAQETEYKKYLPNFLYLKGRGDERGIKIIVSEGSLLMRDSLTYSYEKAGAVSEQVTRKEIELLEKMEELTKQHEVLGKEIDYLRGALDMAKQLRGLYEGVK